MIEYSDGKSTVSMERVLDMRKTHGKISEGNTKLKKGVKTNGVPRYMAWMSKNTKKEEVFYF